MKRPTSLSQLPGRQHGVVMIVTMVILIVLMLGAVALVRSSDTAQFQAGNMAFRRDAVNQSDRVVPLVRGLLTSGALSTIGQRASNQKAFNYSAKVLPVNAQGIPLALLLPDSSVTSATFDAQDFASSANDIAVQDNGVTALKIRYVIDRMCTAVGDESVLGDQCATYTDPKVEGCTEDNLLTCALPVQAQILYRVSIRVTGPRDTQAFFQTTLTR